jgi:hypothetical protein
MFTKLLRYQITIATNSVLFFFSRGKRRKNEKIEEEENYKNSMICRFVLDGIGRKIGESVAVDEDLLIIKSRSKYLGVPLKHIEEDGKTLLVKGLVDQFNAKKMGEKWRQENFKEINYDDDEETNGL